MAQDFVLNPGMYREAYQRGMTLSAFLENLDPTGKYSVQDQRDLGPDAFTRQLQRLDIRTRSIPGAGIAAHTWGRFYDDSDGLGNERKTLAAEWLSRQYRGASMVVPRDMFNAQMGDQRFLTTNAPLSDVLWPFAIDPSIRYQELVPSLLSYMVGRTRTIDNDTFKAFYLADSAVEASARMKRTLEYADLPVMRITGSDNTIRTHKYGRRLQASYEAMRRMSLDMLAWGVRYIAAKADGDKFLTALDVIVNGDGNSGTAVTNSTGSTFDSGSLLTLKMYLSWGMLWRKPYQCNVVIAQDAGVVVLLLLQAGSANLPPQTLVNAQGGLGPVSLARPIYGGVVAINDSSAPSVKLVGFDNRFTLEMVTETASDIVETDRIISAQYEEVAISEVVGFDIMTLGQNRTLAYTA